MKSTPVIALLLLLALTPRTYAAADTDSLSTCLVQSTTNADKLTLVKWMFTAMALHPAVADLAEVSGTSRDGANQAMAALLQSLLMERCLDPARNAIANEGPVAIQLSFSVLGQVAASELFSHPAVASGLAGLDQYIDNAAVNSALGLSQ